MLTLLYPIYNRAHLFKQTLSALAEQTLPRDEFEIIVIDDGSTDNLVSLVTTAREAHGLPIRYAKIDVTRLPWTIFQHEGANNPAPAWNVGLRAARGERVVLTSPEVTPMHPAVLDRIDVWPLEPDESLVADVYDPGMEHHPVLRGWLSGGPIQRVLHFFGTFHTETVIRLGGFDERFTMGWGFEDTEFVHRFLKNRGKYIFSGPSVSALHQPHPRVENVTDKGTLAAKELCERLAADPDFLVANPDHEWGSDALIIERKWWDA